ncbi:unnamed protein product [Toxocara canis]|uniref:ORF5 n=1 Tax=Toxocara canis TaxID=6265 RepID=A0A183UW08_TOXCA|nr:unnamed protein product [Toxocara canis]
MPQDPNSYNRSLCCRMQTIVFVFCVTEITVISVTLTARMKLIITIFFFVCLFVSHEMRICRSTLSSNIFCIEHPLMVCRWTNVSSVEEIEVGDGRGHWMVNEERFCYTHFLVTIIVFLHVVFDCCAMFAIRMQRHRLLLPFLFLTGFDVLALSMFFLTLIIGFVVIGVAYRTWCELVHGTELQRIATSNSSAQMILLSAFRSMAQFDSTIPRIGSGHRVRSMTRFCTCLSVIEHYFVAVAAIGRAVCAVDG